MQCWYKHACGGFFFKIISVLYPGLYRKTLQVPLKKKIKKKINPHTRVISIALLEHYLEKIDFYNLSREFMHIAWLALSLRQ